MFCVKCGKRVNDNIKYCPHCGAAQTAESTAERQLPQSGEQLLSQKENFVKTKKMTKGKIVSIVILIIEALLICGTFVFFNIYNGENDSDNDRKRSRYSLDEANENAELAYGAVEEFINNTYHPQDYAAHGYFLDAFSPDGKGELSEELSKVIDDGYVRVLLHHTEDYYDDLIYTVQWCEDESGDGVVGQYPVPIEKDDCINVEFGTIYDSAEYSNIDTIKENFLYETYENGNIEIKEYIGKEKHVVIPEYIDGHKVVAIYKYAFLGKRFYKQPKNDIESLTIPGTIKEIEENTFSCLKELRSVKISKGVEVIGEGAFGSCDSLEKVEIPRSVEEISGYAFWYCDSLETIEIPSNVESIGRYAFARCDNLKEVNYDKWYRLIFDPTIFLNCPIFIEYIAKVIAIGVFVITLIIILIVRRHKKRKLLKTQRSITQAKPMANDN